MRTMMRDPKVTPASYVFSAFRQGVLCGLISEQEYAHLRTGSSVPFGKESYADLFFLCVNTIMHYGVFSAFRQGVLCGQYKL